MQFNGTKTYGPNTPGVLEGMLKMIQNNVRYNEWGSIVCTEYRIVKIPRKKWLLRMKYFFAPSTYIN